MSGPDLDAIRQRAEAATPGPWGYHDFDNTGACEPTSIAVFRGQFDWTSIDAGEWIAMLDADRQPENDARFIAHARTDVDDLLDLVQRLTRERDEARAALVVDDAMVERARLVLAREGADDPNGWHSWRCFDDARYPGPCTCTQDVARAALEAAHTTS